MTKELAQFLIIAFSGVLFSLGGMYWKPFRRYILPCLWAAILALRGVGWGLTLSIAALYVLIFSLGYGDTVPYWHKALIFIDYVIPSMLLGWTLWQIITPALALLMFWLSSKLQRDFTWRVFEYLCGSMVGITLAVLI